MPSRMQDYLLNKIFTVPCLDRMVCDREDGLFAESCRSLLGIDGMTYGAGIRELYQYMNLFYRNEYYFKNTIFNQLLMDHHDVDTTAAFTEFPIAESKADFVMINGKGVVYEIKTDLDNFNRLESQIMDYYKVFPYVYVVVGYRNYLKVKELLKDTSVGIMVLYGTNNLVCRKKAHYCDRYMSHEAMFATLRKNEYEWILLKHMRRLPEVNNFFYYRECLKWFREIDLTTVYKEVLYCLKQRRLLQKNNALIDTIPYELRIYAYLTRKCDCYMINQFCERRMGG